MDSSQRSIEQPVDLTERITRTENYYTDCGGFGDVWRCMLQTGETQKIVVAVKAIRRRQNSEFNENDLRRELGTWKRLPPHPNILRLLGIARGFSPYISMVSPWLEKGSLTIYLKKHKDIALSDRLRILEDIASGLHFLHRASVVHGDLTPNNVLLDEGERAVLADFGLSSMLVDQGHSYLQLSRAKPGTVRYTAPELLNHNVSNPPDALSDIYSFGCLILQVLSGYEPWPDDKSETSIIQKVTSGRTPQRPVNSQISDEHWHLIQQCFLPLGASPSRPSTDEILKFLKKEGKKSSIPSIGSNGDDAMLSYENSVDTKQPMISPPYNSPSSIPDKRKGSEMDLEWKRKPISNLFRRNGGQSDNKIDAQGASIEQEATSNIMIAQNSLTRVQNFAVSSGGIGNTYQCIRQVNTFKKEKVAVKSIKAQNGDESDIQKARNTILTEVKRWMALQHHNVLPVYGTTTGFGSILPCLVSPWMANGSLTGYLSSRNPKLSIADGLILLSDVVAGLEYLHYNDIIHGNLSSNNVLIDHPRGIRLMDYGLSSAISTCGDLFQSLRDGAPRWTAPELVENQVPSHAGDIYSFGCIAFHVLSGKLPYWWLDDPLYIMYARHQNNDPLGSGTEIGGAYDKFVRHCLSASPKDRPTIDEIKSIVARLVKSK